MPPVIRVIQINIWHGDTARVEETLKNELIFQRVDTGDTKCIGDDRAGSRATRIPPDIITSPLIVVLTWVKSLTIVIPPAAGAPGKLTQIPDDEEIGVKPHRADDVELVIEPMVEFFAVGGPLLPIAPLQTFLTEVAQVAGGGIAGRHFKLGQMVPFAVQVHITTFGDEQAVAQRPPGSRRRARSSRATISDNILCQKRSAWAR